MGDRVVINNLARIKLSDFRKLIRRGNESGKAQAMGFNLCELSYKVYYIPEKKLLLLNWKNDGKEYLQKISLREAPSNLGLNPVLYFVCPYSGKRCRKLFTDGSKFFCMKALTHGYTYSDRNKSKVYRKLSKVLKEPPDTIQRKLYYRGEITPFGKKVFKYYRKQDEIAKLADEVFSSLARKRGRPLGSRKTKRKIPKSASYTPDLFN